jgi:4-amino-4-deoxy-L-arabinose transferase-like glycosyltransferase
VNLPRCGRRTDLVAFGIIAIIVVRLFVGAATPLSADEAYYWLWSKHLAAGYYDHPPAIAFAIRAGVALFGDTSLGVRLVPFVLSIAASFAVWRAGAILLTSEYSAALATLFFNLMPMIAIEALVATPDALEIAAAALLLLALAKVAETGRGAWWLAAGVAGGFALLSKYTAFFLGAGVLVWLLMVQRERRWLSSPWPYMGGGMALLMFAPVILWNADHGWISFTTQFGRIGAGGLTLRYLAEFAGAQVGLATPFIAILGTASLVAVLRSREAARPHLALIAAIVVPATAYFVVHALHDRVQGNWPSSLYPAFAIAAAAYAPKERPHWTLSLSRRLAIPVAALTMAMIYAQGLWGFIPILRDPVSRLLAVGIERFTMDIEILRAQVHADAIVTTGYAPTAWLAFYLPTHPPVIQLNERFRWLNEPPPAASLFNGPLLYVTEIRNDQSAMLKMRFGEVELLALIGRYRSGAELEEYRVYRVADLRAEPFF